MEQERHILPRLYLSGCIMTSVKKCCWKKSAACLTENVCVCACGSACTSAYFCRCEQLEKLPTRLSNLSEVCGPFSLYFPIICPLLPVSSSFSDSLGISPVDVGPSGQSLRRDTRSAWCAGQTLQQRFLCSTHLLVLAHSSGPQHKSGQALANKLVQQPDHFTQDFSVSTVSSN